MAKVALAGSHMIPPRAAAGHILARLSKLPDGSEIHLRRPKTKSRHPGEFELLAAKLAGILGLGVVWFFPEGSERSQTYLRDLEMVRASDYVLAYFWADKPMEGGTGHVVDAALSLGISVEAYSIDDDSNLAPVGSFDPGTDGP